MQGLTGYLLINHLGMSSNRATHWFTKDIRLISVFTALGPARQLFSQMKAIRAVGTSLPPDLLWVTSWAPSLLLPALASRTDSEADPQRCWEYRSDLGTLWVPLCSFWLTDLHVVPCGFLILFYKTAYTHIGPTDLKKKKKARKTSPNAGLWLSIIPLFSQQMLIEQLIRAGHSAQSWPGTGDTAVNETSHLFRGLPLSVLSPEPRPNPWVLANLWPLSS